MDIAECFKDHVAKYEQTTLLGSPVERIIFRNPTSSNYYMSFLAIDRNLIVTGDAYDAIYEVSGRQNMRWWSHTDAFYLASKLRGLNGYSKEADKWCSEQADKELKNLYDELRKEVLEEYRSFFEAGDGEQLGESFEDFCKKKDKELQGEDYEEYDGCLSRWILWNELEPGRFTSTDYEWGTFLNDEGGELFGQCDLPYDIGFIRNPQIDFHLEGLKLAIKQLTDSGVKMLGDA